jgi:hypothetical protein
MRLNRVYIKVRSRIKVNNSLPAIFVPTTIRPPALLTVFLIFDQ